MMDDNNHRFYVQAFYHGGMNSFEVIPDGDHYQIAADGKIIAELYKSDKWSQVSGHGLPAEVLESIYLQIEQRKA